MHWAQTSDEIAMELEDNGRTTPRAARPPRIDRLRPHMACVRTMRMAVRDDSGEYSWVADGSQICTPSAITVPNINSTA